MRVPENRICHALVQAVGEPMMSTSLILAGDTDPLTDPYEIRQILESDVDLVIDGGFCGLEPSTVVELTGDRPRIQGRLECRTVLERTLMSPDQPSTRTVRGLVFIDQDLVRPLEGAGVVALDQEPAGLLHDHPVDCESNPRGHGESPIGGGTDPPIRMLGREPTP